MKKTKMKKQEEMEEKDEEMEGEEEEEEEKGGMMKYAKKSDDLTEDDLQKSINRLATYASEEDMTTRKNQLLEKAQGGEELSKAERDELFDLIGGKVEEEDVTLSKSVTEGLETNEPMQKALDVSEYLQEQHTELVKSLGAVADHVEASDARQHEFNLVLAKAVADVGNLVKAVAEQLNIIGDQPAHAPKSRGVRGGQVIQKSFAGSAPAEDQLSKSQILDTMEQMHVDSLEKGEHGRLNGEGEDILNAISKYESFNQISRPMLAAVEKFRSRSAH